MARKDPNATFHIKDAARALGVDPKKARRRNRAAQEKKIEWAMRHVPGNKHTYYERDRRVIQRQLLGR